MTKCDTWGKTDLLNAIKNVKEIIALEIIGKKHEDHNAIEEKIGAKGVFSGDLRW